MVESAEMGHFLVNHVINHQISYLFVLMLIFINWHWSLKYLFVKECEKVELFSSNEVGLTCVFLVYL